MHFLIRSLAFSSLTCLSMQLYATTFTVTSNADMGANTLRDALLNAKPGDIINITSGLGQINIGATTFTALPILQGVSINGNNNTISGQNTYPIFFGFSGTNTIKDLSLINGKGLGGDGGAGGSGGGGALGAGGALFVNSGAMVAISNIAFTNNTVQGGNGGAANGTRGGGGGGGGYNSNGGATTTAFGGGGGGGGGVFDSPGGSTTQAGGGGGGINRSLGGSSSSPSGGGGGGIFQSNGGAGAFGGGGGGGVNLSPGAAGSPSGGNAGGGGGGGVGIDVAGVITGASGGTTTTSGGGGGGGLGTAGGAASGTTGGTGGAGGGGSGGLGNITGLAGGAGANAGTNGGGGGGGASAQPASGPSSTAGFGGGATNGGGGGGGISFTASGTSNATGLPTGNGGSSSVQGGGGGGGSSFTFSGAAFGPAGNGGDAAIGGGGGGGDIQGNGSGQFAGSGGSSSVLGGGGGGGPVFFNSGHGGTGGSGGLFGGGGGGGCSVLGATGAGGSGGNGGFGGGGGGGSIGVTTNGIGGAGGFGAGSGGNLGTAGGGGSAFGGAIFINSAGILNIANGAFTNNTAGPAGTGSSTGLSQGGDFYINSGAFLTYSVTGSNSVLLPDTIAGAGGLTKLGSGTLILGNAGNSYLGGTTIKGGVLSISNNGDLGDINGGVAFNGGTLALTAAIISSRAVTLNTPFGAIDTGGFNSTFSGIFSGTGGLNKIGLGRLMLSGINNYSGPTAVLAGILQAGSTSAFGNNSDVSVSGGATLDLNSNSNAIGSLSGAGSVTLGAATLSVGKGNFSGNISGPGNLLKLSSGTLTLSGLNALTGLTTVSAGKLVLNGSVAGDALVNGTGILAGTGFISGNLTLDSSGTIAPGNSIGTLSVGGSYTQNSNTTYEVEIDGAGYSDLVDISGSAFLNGGTVAVSSADGTFSFTDKYKILQADTGVYGTFAGARTTQGTPYLIHPLLSYDATVVYLTLQTALINAAKTSNERRTAKQIDSIQDPNAALAEVLSELAILSRSKARTALDELSGHQHTDDLLLSEMINRQFIRRLYDPIRSLVTSEPCCCNDDFDVWFEGGGDKIYLKGNKNAHTVSSRGYDLTTGIQKTFCCDWTLGVAGSFEHDHRRYHHAGHGESDTWMGGLYGLYRSCRYYVLADLAYGYSSNKLTRSIHIGDSSFKAKSDPKVSELTFYTEGGFDWNIGCLLVQPFLGIEVDSFWRKGLVEHHGDFWNLRINKQDRTSAFSRLGIHMTTQDLPYDLILSADLAWVKRLTGFKNSIDVRFVDFGDEFDLNGIHLDNNSVEGAITLISNLCENLDIYAEAAGEAWKDSYAYNLLGGINYSW